jgi:hypothetical protein
MQNCPRKRLLDQVGEKIGLKHYSLKTERFYVAWIKRFILFLGKRHPLEMGKNEIEAFLGWLVAEEGVSPSTQKQTFNALLFLCREVLNISSN